MPKIQAKLPAYLAEAFEDLYAEDGLLVLGRGMGLFQVFSAFCYFYADYECENGHVALIAAEDKEKERERVRKYEGINQISMGSTKPISKSCTITVVRPLVFILGLRESECVSLMNQLQAWGVDPAILPTLLTSDSGLAQDRAAMYRRGGVFVVTSRILIVDLLNQVVQGSEIECFLVYHAETITQLSTEAFILRIYKNQHGHRQIVEKDDIERTAELSHKKYSTVTSAAGAVKTFSSQPSDLLDGFAKVDKVLKSLQVRRLYLYPRFHATVADELDRYQPQVEELHVNLTPLMKEMQHAIASAVQTCIRELKKTTTLIQWSDPEVSIKNCLTKNFDNAIYNQLEREWHKLKFSTRQLVTDLRTLRKLFQFLVEYDCVSFYKLIRNLRTSSSNSRSPSMWLLTPAADLLFRKAKERIYVIQRSNASSKTVSTPSLLPILEENPKLKLLRKILTEIQADWKDKNLNESTRIIGGSQILVMVKDVKSLDVVKSYLVQGKDRMMSLRWLNYLEKINERTRAVIKDAGISTVLGDESRLLMEEESRLRNQLFGNRSRSIKRKRPFSIVPSWLKQRRKVNEEMNRGKLAIPHNSSIDEAIFETEIEYNGEKNDDENLEDYLESESYDNEDLLFTAQPMREFRVALHTYSDVEEAGYNLLLDSVKPMYVVLFDLDAAFVRSLEIYTNSLHHDTKLSTSNVKSCDLSCKVYFMVIKNAAEERSFLKSLEREQNAFERLIQHKKSMPVSATFLGGTSQEILQARGNYDGTYSSGMLPLSVDTRSHQFQRQRRSDKERRLIVVDVREFRSALPSILHQQEMKLAPETLIVGDFVLSPVHCVERKSIGDLFGSFTSGRLYTQAESMSKHYKCPCLLIEFDPDKSFSLQSVNELGGSIKQDSISSRLSLLLIHFPKLRILWSRGPFETVKIFKSLKTNFDEPDIHRAIEMGKEDSIEAAVEGGAENEINEAARDMLLRFPGINSNSARKIIDSCDSIAELVAMTREDIKSLLGPKIGQRLFTFFQKKIAAT